MEKMEKRNNHLHNPPLAETVLWRKNKQPLRKEKLIPRPILNEKITAGMECKLLLLCAPAGYGKTTALIEWADKQSKAVQWIILDEGDNNDALFWMYFIQALPNMKATIRKELLDRLAHNNDSVMDTIKILINELSMEQKPQKIIIENYHVINNPIIDEQLAYFLKYSPEQLTICITSRKKPNIPLSSLRLTDDLHEINSENLKFNKEELAELLSINMNSVHNNFLEQMVSETDGWIAGVKMLTSSYNHKWHLSRTSLRIDEIIRAFFLEEVLKGLDDSMVIFLMKCSICNAINHELSEVLTEDPNAYLYFERLMNENLFIQSQGEATNRLAFHPMFKRLLTSLLGERVSGTEIISLHKKVADWYEGQGNIKEAIYHAAMGKDFKRAAELIEQWVLNAADITEINAITDFIDLLPEKQLKVRPKLILIKIRRLIFEGFTEQARQELNRLNEDWLDDGERTDFFMLDAILSFLSGKTDTIKQVNQACLSPMERTRNSYTFLAFNNQYASILQSEFGHKGKITKAVPFYENILLTAGEGSITSTPFHYVYVLLAEAYYEMGKIEKAFDYVRRVNSNPVVRTDLGLIVPVQLVHMKIKLAEGDKLAAVEILKNLMSIVEEKGSNHWMSIIKSYYARVLLLLDRPVAAEEWKNALNISNGNKVMPQSSNEMITYIRILMKQRCWQEANAWIDRILPVVEQVCGIGTVIQVYNIKAICLYNRNKEKRAYQFLAKSLQYGEENGYLRTFLDEAELTPLLIDFQKNRTTNIDESIASYLEKLLADQISATEDEKPLCNQLSDLTRREMEVLDYLCEGCSNQEISEKLFISLITVKVHLKHIYRKLGVKNRSQAIILCKNLMETM